MATAVRFLLDGEVITLSDVDPTRTVLQYLREDIVRTGTKEGCAEGDCGACMVVVCSLNDNRDGLTYEAINSCIQFVATLDGKELITVESLSPPGGPLHPVQQAMVDNHGSQCGFCTPGFVMTMFAMYKTQPPADRVAIDDALAGNLCRCTGYRPIIDAAVRMYDYAPGETDGHRHATPFAPGTVRANTHEAEVIAQLRDLQHASALAVGSGARHFHAPHNLATLAELCAQHPDATILAGGTDVGLWVTKFHQQLDRVIYIGNVAELQRIEVSENRIEIGAAVTFTQAMPTLLEHYPDLSDLLRRWASPPIRNAATLGGNIANGSPIGDSMPALIAIGARVVLHSGDAQREIALEDLYIDYRKNDLQPGEFVERILVPLSTDGQVVRSYKLTKRFDQDISAVCAAFSAVIRNGVVETIRIAYGGVAGIPKRAEHCEAALTGQPFDSDTLERAMQAMDDDFTPLSDMRASGAYRREAGRNLLKRFHIDVTGDGIATDVYNYGR